MQSTYYLDAPVFRNGRCGHSKFLNTEGLRRAGFHVEDEPESDSSASQLPRRPDVSMTSELRGAGAMGRGVSGLLKPPVTHEKNGWPTALMKSPPVKRLLRHDQATFADIDRQDLIDLY